MNLDLQNSTLIGYRNRHDPNGKHLSGKGSFNFVEIGPISAEAQRKKNPNKGAKAIAARFRQNPESRKTVIAANIVKSSSTDLEEASKDYKYCFATLYDYVDMFIVNVSEPSCKELQDPSLLFDVVDCLLDQRLYFNDYKPIVVELSDDLPQTDLDDIIHYCRMSGVDGIAVKSLKQLRYIFEKTDGRLPVLSKIGFKSRAALDEQLQAGAKLVETTSRLRGARIARRFKRASKKIEKNDKRAEKNDKRE